MREVTPGCSDLLGLSLRGKRERERERENGSVYVWRGREEVVPGSHSLCVSVRGAGGSWEGGPDPGRSPSHPLSSSQSSMTFATCLPLSSQLSTIDMTHCAPCLIRGCSWAQGFRKSPRRPRSLKWLGKLPSCSPSYRGSSQYNSFPKIPHDRNKPGSSWARRAAE